MTHEASQNSKKIENRSTLMLICTKKTAFPNILIQASSEEEGKPLFFQLPILVKNYRMVNWNKLFLKSHNILVHVNSLAHQRINQPFRENNKGSVYKSEPVLT